MLSLIAACLSTATWMQSPPPAPDRPRVEVVVYAAASLRDALQSIATEYEKKNDVKVVFSFGSSGDLARQIVAADKADLFFSADEKEMDRVANEKLLEEGTRRTLLSNQLVVVEPFDDKHPAETVFASPFTVEQLSAPRIRRLSLANTETVPAGRYAKAWLEKKGRWDAVKDLVLPGVDVRAALAAVEAGGAEAGIVYRTDAALSKKVRVVHAVPLAEGPKIAYPLAVTKHGLRVPETKKLAEHLASKPALETFARFGFVLPESTPAAEKPK